MISSSDAKVKIISAAKPLPTEEVPLAFAAGRFLAEDYLAPIDHPFFDQSAMDGYALRWEDLGGGPLRVVGEISAGDAPGLEIQPGEALRIFTGAPVPASADTVVMQEMTERDGDRISITGEVPLGANIRRKGEQLEAGALALPGGSTLNAATIGLLATFGEQQALVRRLPIVAILSTGNEFAESRAELKQGKIFESNGLMLRAALQQMGIESFHATVGDDPDEILKRVEEASVIANVLLTTGGVSVGAHDHTRAALEADGFQVVFHKVNQKPGKPLLFAQKKNGRAAFGLPGNPRSTLVSFYQYVFPYLRKLMGATTFFLPSAQLPLAHPHHKKDGKTHFLTGRITGGSVDILGGQNSHMLGSFAAADVLVEIPAEASELPAGAPVKSWILPK